MLEKRSNPRLFLELKWWRLRNLKQSAEVSIFSKCNVASKCRMWRHIGWVMRFLLLIWCLGVEKSVISLPQLASDLALWRKRFGFESVRAICVFRETKYSDTSFRGYSQLLQRTSLSLQFVCSLYLSHYFICPISFAALWQPAYRRSPRLRISCLNCQRPMIPTPPLHPALSHMVCTCFHSVTLRDHPPSALPQSQ